MSKLDRFRRLTTEEKDRIRQEIIDHCDLVADCWVWNGAKDAKGYGIKYIQGKMRVVSRFMLCYNTRESMDTDNDACHDDTQCCYRACCNPHHLFWGTHRENVEQREQKRRAAQADTRWSINPALGHEMHPVDITV